MTLWWLSFVDKDFLGACVIETSCGGPHGAKVAQALSTVKGCNPMRGMVWMQELPQRLEGKVATRWIGVLLNRDQCNEFGAEHGLVRDGWEN